MKRLVRIGLILAFIGIAYVDAAHAQKVGSVGVRLGIGTDIEGGIAYGAQLNYTLFQDQNAFELGLAVFGGSFDEESNNGFNNYYEETNILVIGAMANYLFRYALELPGPYFVAGIGVGAISVEWEERSDTDVSLGTPLPGGGSMQSEDGTTAGLVLNFGIGHRFNETFDLRAQVPTFFISATDVRDGKVVPTITLTLGLNF
jgi:hypothetical protein